MTKVMRWGAFAAFAALIAVATFMVIAAAPPVQAYAGTGVDYIYRYWDDTNQRVVEEKRWADCIEFNNVDGDGQVLYSGWYIGRNFSDGDRPVVQGTVNLILENGIDLYLSGGIRVPPGNTLNIYTHVYPDGTKDAGKLRVDRSEVDTAAIGGNDNEGCGTINIYGGIIEVRGGSHDTDGGAAIGGGDEGSGGTVNIFGGTVTAKGGPNAAAIGGGEHGNGGTTTIYGGTANATGGSDSSEGGAGIGGGWRGNGGTIRILGGNVTANGGHDGAGIGGGDSGSGGDIEIRNGTVAANGWDSAAIGGGQYGHGGTIKISGGTVTANGGVTSAAIGGGQGGNGGDITISGGNVTATANTEGAGIGGGDAGGSGGNITITGGTIRATGHDAAGIGGGDNGGSSGTIKISGGEITAIAGADAAGIGGGYDGGCDRIEITGGTIKEAKGGSTSNSGGAGIGGGNAHDGGTIIISNVNITAQGGSDGAGIGGGDQASGGNITISADSLDYKIKATGGGYGSGIGGGQGGHGGNVTINGGTVEATGASDAAGIGGGEDGNGGTVTITGGKVTATGSPNNANRDGGAGIGGGDLGNGGIVNISGGEVIATGGEHASGIGGGEADHNNHGNGGTVTITGDARVTAQGGHSGAGIGSGEEGLTGGSVVIGTNGSSTGPTVIATGGTFAAGIGSGDAFIQGSNANVDVKGADVTIYSGDVTAIGGEDAAGIGGGEGANNGTTRIYGGTVVAKAGTAADNDGGAGIGSGDDCIREKSANRHNTTGGTIEIHGGNVTATGNADGAGIGGGDYGSGGNITITGGTVTANGGAYAAGIGGGEGRGAGSVTITGGYVRATGGTDKDGKYGGAGIGGGANIANRTSEQNNDETVGGADQGQAIGEDTISRSGSATVVANGGANAAGIGGGTAGAPGSVTIDVDESGRVDATGGKHAAGIGGGKGNDGEGEGNRVVNYGVSGKITINSGAVTASGGKNGGSGIGTGAACGEPSLNTVDVTINGGDVYAKAGAMDENSKFDSGVAIGAGGQYLKNELNNVEIDDGFVIEDVDIPAIFKGTIKFNGGHVVAQAATVTGELDDYLKNALNAVGSSRSSNVKNGQVEFNGGSVWMWTNGFSDGSATKYSQAVRASDNMIYFTDDPEHQNVFYVLVPEDGEDYQDEEMKNAGSSLLERVYAVTKYDELTDPNNYGLVVVKPQHEHDFTYTAEGDTITAVCSRQSCTLPGHKVTLKIKKPLHAKYDDGLTDNDGEKATIEDPYVIQGNSEIEYYNAKADGTGPEGNELLDYDGKPAPPLGAGTYWAQITLGEGTNSATAHVCYTIEKANNPARVASNAGIIMAEGQSAELAYVDLSKNIKYNESIEDYDPGDQPVTYQIVSENTNGCRMGDGPDDYDTLYASENTQEGQVVVKVTVPGDNNYKSLEANITVTINKKPQRPVTANLVDVETLQPVNSVTYGQDALVLGEVGEGKKTANDEWTLMVDPDYEEYIEIDEGEITVDEDGDIDVQSLPHIKAKKAGVAYIIAMVVDGSSTPSYAPSYAEVEVTITPAELTIKANDETIDLHTAPKGAYTADGLVPGDALKTDPAMTYMQGSVKYIPEYADAGLYSIVPSGADAGPNYTIKEYLSGVLKVREACPVTVDGTAEVFAGGQTVELASNVHMNGATGDVHYRIAGSDFGCTLDEDGTLTSGEADGTVVVYVSVDSDDEYSALSETPIVVTVKPKHQPDFYCSAIRTTYGSTDVVIEPRVVDPKEGAGEISFAVKEGYEEYIDVDPQTGALTIKKVPPDRLHGAYVVATMAETTTYKAATTEAFISIQKAPLTIKAKNEMTTAGDTPTGSYDVEGLVGSDTLTTQPTLTYQKDGSVVNPAKMPAGTYDIIPSGADADGNYEISYENAVLTILSSQPDPTPTPDPDPDPDPDPTPSTTKSALVFDLSGGSLNGSSDAVMIEATTGDTIRMLAAPVRDGYTFKCWRLSAGWELMPGAEFKVDGNHMFTAVWEEQPVSEEIAENYMYRLYNPNTGEHFYTSSLDEVAAVASAGWNWEGIGWTAPSTSSTPVYRLYNSYGGEHHYTINAGERDMLVAAGWTDEGVGWYSDDAQTVPLYREYNPNAFSCNHNYTSNYAEHTWLTSIGWHDEGVAWYGVRSGS